MYYISYSYVGLNVFGHILTCFWFRLDPTCPFIFRYKKHLKDQRLEVKIFFLNSTQTPKKLGTKKLKKSKNPGTKKIGNQITWN